ncbi:MAG: hypothetical protein D6B27_06595 [Gammaproteobacteria bacterium]|nr:MAG: hypothetical protein D6B27_06595 [Gammaproteobacteria bacterium]
MTFRILKYGFWRTVLNWINTKSGVAILVIIVTPFFVTRIFVTKKLVFCKMSIDYAGSIFCLIVVFKGDLGFVGFVIGGAELVGGKRYAFDGIENDYKTDVYIRISAY